MLSEALQQELSDLPEYAMDSQIVDFRMKDGTIVPRVVVAGCRLAQLPPGVSAGDIAGVERAYRRGE